MTRWIKMATVQKRRRGGGGGGGVGGGSAHSFVIYRLACDKR